MTPNEAMRKATREEIREWHDRHYAPSDPEIHRKTWQRYEGITDPYNQQNTLTGYVQMSGGDDYGCLLIEEVNGKAAPQKLRGAPKTNYPFSHDQVWLIEDGLKVRRSVKYDGTNICQFAYQDGEGNTFTSYRVRTRPLVPERFRGMLDRTLARYPMVRNLELQPGEAHCYEMYGEGNPSPGLIRYEVEEELVALFRRRPGDNGVEPADGSNPAFARLDCPLSQVSEQETWHDAKAMYTARQNAWSERLVANPRDGERAFNGHEGEMLYVAFNDGDRTEPGAFTRLIKLKPSEIVEIHHELERIPEEEIQATLRNIYETSDTPTIEDLRGLLRQDWSGDQIRRSQNAIDRVWNWMMEDATFNAQVMREYRERFNEDDFADDRKAVMNAMGEIFSKWQIVRVFQVLENNLGGGKEDAPVKAGRRRRRRTQPG